ncbi:MAG: hypothetical protein ACI841_004076 [Planctomycetota bacterium]|jgi:hypothetical protein
MPDFPELSVDSAFVQGLGRSMTTYGTAGALAAGVGLDDVGVVAGGALGAVFGAAVFLVGSLFDVVFGTPPPPPQPPPPPPPPV